MFDSGMKSSKTATNYQYNLDDGYPQKIVGDDLEDCRKMLYEQFGRNYQILGQRPVPKKSFLGLSKKMQTEVRYCVKKNDSSPDSFVQKRDELLSSITSNPAATIQMAKLNEQLEELQKNLGQKLDQISKATASPDKHPSIQKIEDLLSENEFTFSYINSITSRLNAELSLDQLNDFSLVEKTVVDWIGQSIKIQKKVMHKLPHVVIIVGPTGVGKTTTIAKLAGTLIMEAKANDKPKPSIRMITIDHTRVGAEEQLRRFGELMYLDVDKAETAEDVKRIFDTYKDNLDALFIDTPGYSPNDYENIGKMRAILEVAGLHPDIYLAVTASVKARDLVSIIQNYETFDFKSVIITKWDETTAIGNVLSVLSEKNKKIAYITDGQQVPRKIERASVIKFLTNLNDFKIDRIHIEDMFSEDK